MNMNCIPPHHPHHRPLRLLPPINPLPDWWLHP